VAYDEFGLFHENAAEFGLPYPGPPAVARVAVPLSDGRQLSALRWGIEEPQLVLLHGGAQNAHTWDTVALALGRPLVAVDLPGHGHSDDGRRDQLSVHDHAADVAEAVTALAPHARAVVGMSLGGVTTLALYARAPERVRGIVLVDVLPSVNPDKARLITDFVDGPPSFASFDDLLARTIEHNPTRSVSSLRRGILHNAVQLDDGSWVWRHARHRRGGERQGRERQRADQPGAPAMGTHEPADRESRFADLWDVVSSISVPLLLVRGMAASSVLDDAHEDELRRRLPGAQVSHVEGAGHSVQGDRPLELARLIDEFVPA
jgi:pimeloyl-ACP methyl ester carboxylesterase